VKNGLGAVGFANDLMTGTYTYTVGSVFVVWNHPTTVAGDIYPAMFSTRTTNSSKTANGSLNWNLMLPNASNVALDPKPGSSTNRLNGVAVTSAAYTDFPNGLAVRTSPDRWQYTSSTFTAVSGSKPFTIGADTFAASGRTMQNGHIGEILVYSGTLTSTQVLAVEAYLIAKWGLA
jgi:hypothetical protein